jgi:predicted phage terminase large subunit-like protein
MREQEELRQIEERIRQIKRTKEKKKREIQTQYIQKTPEKISFREYIEEGWKEAATSSELKNEFYVNAIAEHLEALYNREIKNLIINIAPRHAKSTICSVLFPTWIWTFNPEHQFITASYSDRLVTRDAVASRRLILSDWYQSNWGHLYELREDVNQKKLYETDKNGRRYSTTVAGGGVGEGADIIIVDDPHKPLEVKSKVYRERVIDWFVDTLSTRWNNRDTFAKLIIMQRLHENDLCGYLIDNEPNEWCILRLPTEFEGDRSKNLFGWSDPRTIEGELLSPSLLNEEAVEKEKKKGRIRWANQFQQRPVPEEGGHVLKSNILKYKKEELSNLDLVIASFDLAKGINPRSKFTVGTVWGKKKDNKYLLKMIRKKILFGEQIDEIVTLAEEMRNIEYILIESELHGTAVIEEVRKRLREKNLKTRIIPIDVKGLNKDKETRFLSIAKDFEELKIYVPDSSGAWVDIWIDEITKFPLSTYTDIVDSTSQAITWLNNKDISQKWRNVDEYKKLLKRQDLWWEEKKTHNPVTDLMKEFEMLDTNPLELF